MIGDDERAYLGPYQRAVDSHGPGFPALLFGSREHQRRRFEVLCATMPLAGRRIADLGCGHGDLLAWLCDHDVAYADYLGIEAIPEFVGIARGRLAAHPQAAAEFVLADFVAEPERVAALIRARDIDMIVLSGSLNTLDEAAALAVLERAWAALDGRPAAALGFNFLAGGGDWDRPATRLPRRDTERWVSWALARTSRVIFCQHYLGAHDATIVLFRPD
ncbi:Methyltransferase domain protein [Enhygromyxa salina]|uniref:Methyltransferase domain protein n=1 Tax=Enhygromyxa salina TaxID=215803 RepID=A0A2S9YXB2_9BACT|nr:Methyltransferase domain protein [Enhygromyxa salina]